METIQKTNLENSLELREFVSCKPYSLFVKENRTKRGRDEASLERYFRGEEIQEAHG
jgi:hypothetical protein